MQDLGESAAVDSNIEATVDFESIENFDLDRNKAPLITIGTILIVFFPVFFCLRRKDNKQFDGDQED